MNNGLYYKLLRDSNKGTISQLKIVLINPVTRLDILEEIQQVMDPSIAESFLHLLENFANNAASEIPYKDNYGMIVPTGVNTLKLYDGTGWINASGLKKGNTVPMLHPLTGDPFDTDNNQALYSI